ncbi:MAG: flagellar biosynthesis anti-sigma factor FlgM [Anaerovibrio sp.]|uniref:flagellar biosynthesis anti-sigma factor FlgM n=1 Tax=Anaerovibrio sp. TaxID=1872532 RepID=UPI0025EE2DC9|nr:flagellar biosynthesis anti-sigma factor FlgM [Anaerovibrio sp.]MCR5176495.1 flagellar biosynthesis anti-sigma factor FlgM [Anaerovibrio sp.]
MIINNNLQGIASIYANQGNANKSAKSVQEMEKRDEIHISKQGQNVSEMVKKMNEMDDIRQDRVTELENLIASGNYHVSSRELAESIMQCRF